MKRCKDCKETKSLEEFYFLKSIGYYSTRCKICHNLNTNGHRKNIRNEAITKYGGCCVRCGFSDTRALQFDHINGGGLADRKIYNTHDTLKDILNREPNTKYQLLCANCNMIKKHENSEHGFSYAKKIELRIKPNDSLILSPEESQKLLVSMGVK